MRGVAGLFCPECGHQAPSESALFRRRTGRRWLTLCALALLAAAVLWFVPVYRSGRWTSLVPTGALIALMPWWEDNAQFKSSTMNALSEEFRGRRQRGELSDAQWNKVCEHAARSAEQRFAAGERNNIHRYGRFLSSANRHGKLSRHIRDRLNALFSFEIGWTTPLYEGYPVYADVIDGIGWPLNDTIAERLDMETRMPVASGPYSNAVECRTDAAFRLGSILVPIAVVKDAQRPVCILVRASEVIETPNGSPTITRTFFEDAVEVPGPILRRQDVPITPRRSEAVERAIQTASFSLSGDWLSGISDEDTRMCFSIEPVDLRAIFAAEGIDTLAVRFELLFGGVAVAHTGQWPGQPGVLSGLYGLQAKLTPKPRIIDPRQFQIRVVGDVATALRFPGATVCWEGEVVVQCGP
ncbi:MAG: hypothetical protein J0L61_00360 [Planctomycetes bacterium]|nr:hypothetical protein [Planctomycetota bacterium]